MAKRTTKLSGVSIKHPHPKAEKYQQGQWAKRNAPKPAPKKGSGK